MKATWNTINEIIYITKKNSNKSPNININGTLKSNEKEVCNHFNSYFKNIGTEISNNIPNSPTSYQDYLTPQRCKDFKFDLCNEIEVYETICNLKNSVSVGLDNISTFIIKLAAPSIARPLTTIINHSFTQCVFTDALKLSKIIPLFKGGFRIRG